MNDEVPTPTSAPPHRLGYAPRVVVQRHTAMAFAAAALAVLPVPLCLACPRLFDTRRGIFWDHIVAWIGVGLAACAIPMAMGFLELWRARRARGAASLLGLLVLWLGVANLPLGLWLVQWQTERSQRLHAQDHALYRCASNLRQIGTACLIYAAEPRHGNRFPGTLEEIVDSGIDPHDFVCLFSGDVPPARSTTRTDPDLLSRPGYLSYVYVGQNLTAATATANTVVAYERPSNHDAQGLDLWVLYGDGSVRAMSRSALEQLIQSLPPATRPASP